MAKVCTDNRYYGEIAAAIRTRSQSTDSYRPDEMAAAVRAIPAQTGPVCKLTDLTVSAARSVTATARALCAPQIPEYAIAVSAARYTE